MIISWLVGSTPPKNISQLALVFLILKNVPNHQPGELLSYDYQYFNHHDWSNSLFVDWDNRIIISVKDGTLQLIETITLLFMVDTS